MPPRAVANVPCLQALGVEWNLGLSFFVPLSTWRHTGMADPIHALTPMSHHSSSVWSLPLPKCNVQAPGEGQRFAHEILTAYVDATVYRNRGHCSLSCWQAILCLLVCQNG